MRGTGSGGTDTGPRRGTGLAPRVLVAGALVVAPLLNGCGIRTTTVPVDAGPAPSRASCAVPHSSTAPEPQTVLRQVYLVCGMQVTPVKRRVPVRAGASDRIGQIRELLGQLQRGPLAGEAQAGFSTAVPGSLEVTGPLKDDPGTVLRLGQPLDELPSFALAQIVCTLTASTDLVPGGTVLLGGTAPGGAVRTYACTPDLRTGPDPAAGVR